MFLIKLHLSVNIQGQATVNSWCIPVFIQTSRESYILNTEVQKVTQKRHASWLARLSLAAWGTARAHITNCLILCWTHGSGASLPLTTAEDKVLLSRSCPAKRKLNISWHVQTQHQPNKLGSPASQHLMLRVRFAGTVLVSMDWSAEMSPAAFKMSGKCDVHIQHKLLQYKQALTLHVS